MSTEPPAADVDDRAALQEPACFRNSRSDSYHRLDDDGERPACSVGTRSRDVEWRVVDHRGELPLGADPCQHCYGEASPRERPGPTCPLCQESVAAYGLDAHLSDCPARE